MAVGVEVGVGVGVEGFEALAGLSAAIGALAVVDPAELGDDALTALVVGLLEVPRLDGHLL